MLSIVILSDSEESLLMLSGKAICLPRGVAYSGDPLRLRQPDCRFGSLRAKNRKMTQSNALHLPNTQQVGSVSLRFFAFAQNDRER